MNSHKYSKTSAPMSFFIPSKYEFPSVHPVNQKTMFVFTAEKA